mmetsp:Transcript_31448/g.48103  ORF Transcript_31448/g.48103 Transcript_31448/m.48103 type:complete len:461 (-) Transcript_31448:36-1418(-)
MLVKMLDAGMNVARLNFSHGDHKTHGQSLQNLKAALKERPDKTCAVLLDTKGPEIRTGFLKDHQPIEITAGQSLKITTDYDFLGDNTAIACSYEALPETVKVGSPILIADGSLTCEVTEVHDDYIIVECKNGCKIGERKNMNLPGAIVDLPTLTEKDEDDLVDFGIKQNVDFIAASFVRKASDVENIKDVLGPKGAHIRIISKIENHEGLENYTEILKASDGIMVARGDLGMEIAPEKVFIAQKWMIEKANLAAKPIITATQMLESMIKAPRPTRAEASDVANAVLDGTDAVMLSGECANGDYPINAVEIMARICVEAEHTVDYRQQYQWLKDYTKKPFPIAEAVSSAVCSAVLDQKDIQLIIVLTDSGKLARLVSKYRPEVNILACSINAHAVRQMGVMRGVIGLKIPTFQGTDNVIQFLISEAKSMKLCKSGDKTAIIHGTNEETPDESNIMKILDIA